MRKPVAPSRTSAPVRRLAVVFPGEPVDRNYVAPESWLADPLIAEASACAGSDVRRAFSPRREAAAARGLSGVAIVQPALVALELVAWRKLRARGVVPMLVTGQSSGEIAAWAAGGGIEDHDALRLAALRGAAVQLASIVHPSTRRASPGGWNTIAMAPARDTITGVASSTPRYVREVAQVSCLDGAVLAGDEAPDLGAQLVEPASWRRVIDSFLRFAITDVAVLAPGQKLRNMLRDAFSDSIVVHAAENESDFDRLASSFAHVAKEVAS